MIRPDPLYQVRRWPARQLGDLVRWAVVKMKRGDCQYVRVGPLHNDEADAIEAAEVFERMGDRRAA